jgi:hypothetical protein
MTIWTNGGDVARMIVSTISQTHDVMDFQVRLVVAANKRRRLLTALTVARRPKKRVLRDNCTPLAADGLDPRCWNFLYDAFVSSSSQVGKYSRRCFRGTFDSNVFVRTTADTARLLPRHYYFVFVGLFYPYYGAVLGSQIERAIWPPVGMMLLPNIHVSSKLRSDRMVFSKASRKFCS